MSIYYYLYLCPPKEPPPFDTFPPFERLPPKEGLPPPKLLLGALNDRLGSALLVAPPKLLLPPKLLP